MLQVSCVSQAGYCEISSSHSSDEEDSSLLRRCESTVLFHCVGKYLLEILRKIPKDLNIQEAGL